MFSACISPPAECVISPCPTIEFIRVMFFGADPLLSQLMEKFSSCPQANEQWSKIMFCPLAMPAQSLSFVPTAPMRKRI